MEKTRVIKFEMTYGEYLALVVAATAEISITDARLESKKEHEKYDELYYSSKARVEALRSVLKKMDDRVNAVIREDVDKKFEFTKG